MHYIVSYDITDDKRRNKIHKYLIRNEAIRLQYSVYLLRVDTIYLRDLIQKLNRYISKPEVESIYILKSDPKLLKYNIDNDRLKFFLSREIENIYI